MTKFKLIAISVAAVTAIVAGSAIALAGWCWSDPVIGVTAPGNPEMNLTIDVAIDTTNIPKLSGPVQIKVYVPSNVNARVKSIDNIIPEQVTIIKRSDVWIDDGIPIQVKVKASSAFSFPVQYRVRYTAEGGAAIDQLVTGTSNSDISHTGVMVEH